MIKKNRIDKLQKCMIENKIDGFILTSKESIGYISGIFNDDAYLCVKKDKCIYITDNRYIFDLREKITDNIELVNIQNSKEYKNFFSGRICLEEGNVTIAQKENMLDMFGLKEIQNGQMYIDELKKIKDEDEILKIKEACKITDDCYKHIQKYFKEGITEKELKAEIDKYFEINASGIAFETIVAFSKNSAKPHAISENNKLKKADVILIDMGAKYDGYCSDMTRTFLFGDVPSKVKEAYEFVLNLQKECIAKVKEGTSIKKLNEIFVTRLNEKNYDVMHALGHGVGVYIHEKPFISKRDNDTLKENMVIAIEPGIYIENKFGIRIEDTVLIEKEKATLLTKSKK